MPQYFYELLQFFNAINHSGNAFAAYIALLGVAAVTAVLRISLYLVYQGQRGLVWKNSRSAAKTLHELKDGRAGILTSVAREYIGLCESGITTANVRDIADMHIGRLGAFGWSFSGVLRFAEGFERSIVPAGLLLALVFDEARIAFGLSAAALWLALRLLSAVFDVRLAREQLHHEAASYVTREAAKFFTPDITANLTILRGTLQEAIKAQSDAFSAASRMSGETVSAAVSKSLGDMSRSIEHTLIKLADVDTLLKEPMSRWNDQISRAAQLQHGANQSNERLLHAITQFSDVAGTLANMLTELERHSPDKAVKNYESVLEDLTRKLGEGFGTMLDHHVSRSLNNLTSGLEDSVSNMTRTNQDLAQTLRNIADRLDEQGRNEVRAIAAVKEQIDIRLDELRGHRHEH
ncbi:MAG: hypothetical protein FWD98_00085 [Defluviitaleaceae bacterium]|nr:hypothetical protein [Defluviitaleaceae bacterium]